MADVFTSAQLEQMQTDINTAATDLENNDPTDAKSAISAYYEIQFGKDGYSTLANAVVTDTTLDGQTADQLLADDGIPYGSEKSVQVMLDLALANLTDISNDPNYAPPTLTQIESEHEAVYVNKDSISIAYWGATAFSNAGENWLGGVATAHESSNTINSYFQSLPASVVSQNEENLLEASFIVQLENPFDYVSGQDVKLLAGLYKPASEVLRNLCISFRFPSQFDFCKMPLHLWGRS
jgi:hypothetical protein